MEKVEDGSQLIAAYQASNSAGIDELKTMVGVQNSTVDKSRPKWKAHRKLIAILKAQKETAYSEICNHESLLDPTMRNVQVRSQDMVIRDKYRHMVTDEYFGHATTRRGINERLW
jgi:hypothetical protein